MLPRTPAEPTERAEEKQAGGCGLGKGLDAALSESEVRIACKLGRGGRRRCAEEGRAATPPSTPLPLPKHATLSARTAIRSSPSPIVGEVTLNAGLATPAFGEGEAFRVDIKSEKPYGFLHGVPVVCWFNFGRRHSDGDPAPAALHSLSRAIRDSATPESTPLFLSENAALTRGAAIKSSRFCAQGFSSTITNATTSNTTSNA